MSGHRPCDGYGKLPGRINFLSEYYRRPRKRGRPTKRPHSKELAAIESRIKKGEIHKAYAARALGVCVSTLSHWLPNLPKAAFRSRWQKKPPLDQLNELTAKLIAGEITRREIATRFDCSREATYAWISAKVAPSKRLIARAIRPIEFSDACNCGNDECNGMDCS